MIVLVLHELSTVPVNFCLRGIVYSGRLHMRAESHGGENLPPPHFDNREGYLWPVFLVRVMVMVMVMIMVGVK